MNPKVLVNTKCQNLRNYRMCFRALIRETYLLKCSVTLQFLNFVKLCTFSSLHKVLAIQTEPELNPQSPCHKATCGGLHWYGRNRRLF